MRVSDPGVVSRRTMLGLVSAAAGAAALGPGATLSRSQTPSGPPRPRLARFYPTKLGLFDAVVVSDGVLPFEPVHPSFGPDLPAEEVTRTLESVFVSPAKMSIECNCLAVRTPEGVVMVDAGCGTIIPDTAGRLHANLADAGVKASDVTAVVLTHAHPDHVGGLFGPDDAPAFPNARVFVTRREAEWWLDGAPELDGVRVPEEFRVAWRAAASARLRSSALEPVEPGREFLPGFEFIDTSGHTPGHASLVITSGSDALLVTGDVLAHHALGIDNPAVGSIFDTDPAAAQATRRRLLDRLAADRTRALVFHLDWPGIGRIRRSAGGYQWVSEPWSWDG